jgi:hypothetical protein
MRDVNRLQRALILLALFVWQMVEAMREIAYVPAGVDDPDWQHVLHDLAEPIREHRLLVQAVEDSGEHLALPPAPVLAVPVVMSDGTTTITIAMPVEAPVVTVPRPPRKRNHRTVKAALLSSGAPEVLAVERRVRHELNAVIRDAMLALGLSPEEVRAVLRVKQFERTLDNVMGLA